MVAIMWINRTVNTSLQASPMALRVVWHVYEVHTRMRSHTFTCTYAYNCTSENCHVHTALNKITVVCFIPQTECCDSLGHFDKGQKHLFEDKDQGKNMNGK